MSDRIDTLLDVLALHFAQRREALDIITRFGNRFEGCFKWECAQAFHVASFTGIATGIELVSVEREDCDLFLGGQQWLPGGGYPPQDGNDVWIELKARSTADRQGPGGLASEILTDDSKLAARQRHGDKGRFLVLALIVAHHRSGDVDKWLASLAKHRWLGLASRSRASTARCASCRRECRKP